MSSVFDGTWRPDYEPPGADEPPTVYSLVDGIFECQTCNPPLRVAANGQEQVVQGSPRFETISITVVDEWNVRQVGRRRDAIVYESSIHIDAGGQTHIETRTAVTMVDGELVPMVPAARGGDHPQPVRFRIAATRVGLPVKGAHLLTGAWRTTELDLVDHDEDTTFLLADNWLSMSDGLGRSFMANVDGTVAPYVGDPRYSGVSVLLLDQRTLQESDLDGESVVQTLRWQVDVDGRTMHVRFESADGRVMEQTGHKL